MNHNQSNQIVFYNPSILDMRAVTTFGLSVKESENPIGYFGTGLKYAIAILLREGCEIKIYSDGSEYIFYSQKDKFRGVDCDLVYMDSPEQTAQQLPFTLELGKNWELWQAYRELYCNAIDEQGGVCDKHSNVEGIHGHTFIAISGDKFLDVHKSRREFIIDDNPLIKTDALDIMETPGAFLKGIKVSDSIFYKPLYGYNFHGGISLTEDRTLKDSYVAEDIIQNKIIELSDYNFIQNVLTAPDNTFEKQISWAKSKSSKCSDIFRSVILDLARNQPTKISINAKELAIELDDKISSPAPYKLNKIQQESYIYAKEFLMEQDINLDDYPVYFVKTLGNNIWGKAYNGEILISSQCFDYGTKCLVATLYEEHLHLSTGMHDCSREMQNHLFHTIVGLWENANGKSL